METPTTLKRNNTLLLQGIIIPMCAFLCHGWFILLCFNFTNLLNQMSSNQSRYKFFNRNNYMFVFSLPLKYTLRMLSLRAVDLKNYSMHLKQLGIDFVQSLNHYLKQRPFCI